MNPYRLHSTEEFQHWLIALDNSIRLLVLARFARIEQGNFGDYKKLSPNLYELRFNIGGGIRVYYTLRNNEVVLLIAGGNKKSQEKDINRAQALLDNQ